MVCGGKQGWGGPAKSHSPKTSPVKAPQGSHTEEQLGEPGIPCRDTLWALLTQPWGPAWQGQGSERLCPMSHVVVNIIFSFLRLPHLSPFSDLDLLLVWSLVHPKSVQHLQWSGWSPGDQVNMNVGAEGRIWLNLWRWPVRAALITFQTPHCTGAEQYSGAKRQHCVPAETLHGAQDTWDGSRTGAEARKDIPGQAVK